MNDQPDATAFQSSIAPESAMMSTPASVSWHASGRVNLIGEHTDYNHGFALPFAIEQGCNATATITSAPLTTICSTPSGQIARYDSLDLQPAGSWGDYAAGVLWAFHARGVKVPSLDINVRSTVPIGAGLSSSAALTCSVAGAVNDLLHLGLDNADLLAVTRSAENDFVGAPTGGLDQLACLNCRRGYALLCDMHTLTVEHIPLRPQESGLAILVVDTRTRHGHADGNYRRRRAGCEQAAQLLGLSTLRDLTVADLPHALPRLHDDELRRYARHVVTENERVLTTTDLLLAGQIDRIGPQLTASHQSLRNDYQVSTPAVDRAVAELLHTGALGARMTGGGFGGCVIALFRQDALRAATKAITRNRPGNLKMRAFTTQPCQGAHGVAEH